MNDTFQRLSSSRILARTIQGRRKSLDVLKLQEVCFEGANGLVANDISSKRLSWKIIRRLESPILGKTILEKTKGHDE